MSKGYLITGGSGQLGTDLKMLMDTCGVSYLAPSETELDFCIPESVENFFRANGGKFSFVIHCAAFTNVDACEVEREKAFLINAGSTETLARICRRQDIPMLYISTDFVFDGSKKVPYETSDMPAPLSAYGAGKLEGERTVRKNCPRHYIVRTSWLFGIAGNNFPRAILKKAAGGEALEVVDDQVGSPTFSRDLAEALLAILGIDYPFSGIRFSGKAEPAPFGTYHFSNAGAASWFDFAREILRSAGRENEIAPITSAQLGREAARPAYSVLSHAGINGIGITARPWREALDAFISELRIRSPELFPTEKFSGNPIMPRTNEAGSSEDFFSGPQVSDGKIGGVKIKKLKRHCDDRGFFQEILRDDENLLDRFGQLSMSRTFPGVIKAFHYHEHQDDLWFFPSGNAQVVLHDLRKESPSSGVTEKFYLGEDNPALLVIPKGVAHGYRVLGNVPAVIIYCTTRSYDPSDPDEKRLPYDDPGIGFNWETENR